MRTLAEKALELARDQILIQYRYFAPALGALRFTEKDGTGELAADGTQIFYDSLKVLEAYKKEPASVTRSLLHILLHSLFHHDFLREGKEEDNWNLAADLAVEAVILELNQESISLKKDIRKLEKLEQIRREAGGMTAGRIYRRLQENPPAFDEKEELKRLFFVDDHRLWTGIRELAVTKREWEKIRERLRAELNSFSKNKGNTEGLRENLEQAVKERYDYSRILARFMTMGEQVGVNEAEFDLVYYTYGLRQYGKLPLLEPLEYREIKKIREFVIVIDTSASCRGALVRAFLKRTYQILKSSESFFSKINLHLIQCDQEVQRDDKITNDADFENFLKNGELKGFGATDFRPAFSYVETLREKGEFENLKGLIYFTDGYGIYPETMPDYQVLFAFVKDDDKTPGMPPWALKVVLEEEELEDRGEKP